jgi:hypothetical protein
LDSIPRVALARAGGREENTMMRSVHVRRWVLAAALGIAVVGNGSALAQGRTPEDLVQVGDDPDAVIMYTGDVIGYVEPCG